MSIEKLEDRLNRIINLKDIGAAIYFDTDNGLFRVNHDDAAETAVVQACRENLVRQIFNRDLDLMKLSDADERSRVIYHYDYSALPLEMAALIDLEKNQKRQEFKRGFGEVKAVATILGNAEDKMILYKWYYPVNVIKKSRVSLILGEGNMVKLLTSDLLGYSASIDVLVVDSEVYVLNLEAFEKKLDFKEILARDAKDVVEKIQGLKILASDDKLNQDLQDDVKRLAKLKNSKVLNSIEISGEQILGFCSKHHRLGSDIDDSGLLKANSAASMRRLYDLLNDQYLHSELTGSDYNAIAKNDLGPT